jgi:hypothetical protein
MRKLFILAFALATIAIAPKTYAQTKMVGGAAMYPTKILLTMPLTLKTTPLW